MRMERARTEAKCHLCASIDPEHPNKRNWYKSEEEIRDDVGDAVEEADTCICPRRETCWIREHRDVPVCGWW